MIRKGKNLSKASSYEKADLTEKIYINNNLCSCMFSDDFPKSRKASSATIPHEKHLLLALRRKPKVSAHHMRA